MKYLFRVDTEVNGSYYVVHDNLNDAAKAVIDLINANSKTTNSRFASCQPDGVSTAKVQITNVKILANDFINVAYAEGKTLICQ